MVYWLILHRKSGQCGFTACPDGRLHHLGNSPASVRAKVMGRLFFLESYCVTQPLTPRRLYQRLFCVPSCRIFTFVSGHCWLPMRGDGFSMADFFMSGGLNAAGSRLKESGQCGFGLVLAFRLLFLVTGLNKKKRSTINFNIKLFLTLLTSNQNNEKDQIPCNDDCRPYFLHGLYRLRRR